MLKKLSTAAEEADQHVKQLHDLHERINSLEKSKNIYPKFSDGEEKTMICVGRFCGANVKSQNKVQFILGRCGGTSEW